MQRQDKAYVQDNNKGGTIPRAPNHRGGAESPRGRWITVEGAENPSNVTNTFCSTVNLLAKELRFEYAGAKLASCPGHHLTSLRPCICSKLSLGMPIVLLMQKWNTV